MEDSANFAFCFNGETEAHPSLSADVLFDGGKIRPLKLLTRSEYVRYSPDQSPRSPKRMLMKSVLVSPRRHNQKSTDSPLLITPAKKQQQELSSSYFTADNSKLISEPTLEKQTSKDTTCSSFFSSSSSSSTNRSIMWKLLDLLMMCGCSENVANKVDESASMMRSSYKKDTNEWSFRSDNSTSSKSTGGGGSSRKGSTASVSAHEWHYKKKREAAEEMKRKTFLPYKKSLLGCMDHVDVDTGTVLEFYRGQRVVEITC